jgi:hypothetical protein
VTDTLISQLLDFGALGIFAGFLVWQHLGMQKRLDTLVESFQSQLRDIQAREDAQEERLRDRYDAVIAKYDSERTQTQSDIVTKLDTALVKLDEGLKELDRRSDGSS